MWNGKNKAVTFSYDDGIEQDKRLVDIFNTYGLKCTFNLNSGIMNEKGNWITQEGITIKRMTPEGLPELYKGHEIAVHCVTHACLQALSDDEAISEIVDDRAALEKLFDCKINGMAYPYGAFDERVMRLAAECGIKFSRTTIDRHDFKIPENLLAFGATCHHSYPHLDKLLDDFLAYDGEDPAVFCLWGHSYEFDLNENWSLIENFCKKISGRDDIFYGTNSEVYL